MLLENHLFTQELKLTTRALVSQVVLAATVGLISSAATAAPLYFNGFETDIAGWETPTRVATGTGGIASSSGSFHATTAAGAGDFTRWGGYNYGAGNAVPTAFQGYRTSVDIYLDVSGGWANDTRFDFSSAINGAATGTHRRDFVFNGGFYSDATGPGASTDRFVISAGTNAGRANSFPKNTGAIAISTTGWYSFEHTFYDNAGVLAVDMAIFDAADLPIGSWTVSIAADVINLVGGNRYGWFANNEFSPSLAFDNTLLEITPSAAVPEPATLLLVGASLLGLAATRRRRT